MAITDRLKKAWNAFANVESSDDIGYSVGTSFGSVSPSRPTLRFYNDRSIVTAIYNRISIDVADILLRHAKLDDQGRYSEDVKSHLNHCLNLEPNLDQTPRAFRQDIVMTLFDKGVSAIVAVDTTRNPETNEVIDILSLRVGEIIKWGPKHVKVSVYNEDEKVGARQEITLEKSSVAIVENPLYSVMNGPNSTLQRLIKTLGHLDAVGEQSSSGKLDLIIQLPYVIKSEARKQQAEKRREDIEFQLKGSQYGIAYTDGTEKITQLNRPAENNLLKQVEYLTVMLYGQLGITEEVMNGTADEKTMINYHNRTVKPIVDAIKEAMQKSFLGLDKMMKNERILYFNDVFKLVPMAEFAEIADKLTRNEVASSNELRGFIGIPPSKDPKADQLVNSNMPQAATGVPPAPPAPTMEDMDGIMEEVLGGLEKDIDKLTEKLGGG